MLVSVRKEVDRKLEEKTLGKEVSCWLIGGNTSVDW